MGYIKIGFYIFDIIVLISLALYLLIGFIKGWKKTLFNLISFLIPFIILVLVSNSLASALVKIEWPVIGNLETYINSLLENENNNSEMTSLALNLATALIKLVIYYVGALLCLLLAQVNRIIFHFTLKNFFYPDGDKKAKPTKKARFVGMGIGFARFIVATVVLSFPIYGLLNVAQMGVKDAQLIETITSENSEEIKMAESTIEFDEIYDVLGTSITYKIFTSMKSSSTEVSLPATYLGTVIKVKTENGSYNLIKEYGNIHAVLKVVAKMDITDEYISFEKLTDDDIKVLKQAINKMKLLNLVAPLVKEALIEQVQTSMNDSPEKDEIVKLLTNMNMEEEIDVLLEATNNLIDLLKGLKININHPEDLLLESNLPEVVNEVLNVLVKSTTVKEFVLPLVCDKIIESINDETGEMEKVVTTDNLMQCLENDISELIQIYQSLSKNNNLHNFIFNDQELITDTTVAATSIEESVDKIFRLSIIKGNEKSIIVFALSKAEQDNLTYDILFKDLNVNWQEEGKTLGKILKEVLMLPESSKNFDNFSLETLVMKNDNGEYVYDALIKEIAKSQIFRNVGINLLETFKDNDDYSDLQEVLNLLNIASIKSLSENEFYQELISLLEIVDVVVEMNLLDSNPENYKIDENNIELLITKIFDSVLVKNQEEEILDFILNKTDVSNSLEKMGIEIEYDNIDWEQEPTKLIDIFKALLQFGDLQNIDFENLLNDRNSETNDKIVNLLVALRSSQIFEPILFNMIDTMVKELNYQEVTDFFDFNKLRDLTSSSFKAEIINLLEIIDTIEAIGLGSETLNLTKENVGIIIDKVFASCIIEGNEANIINYIFTECAVYEMLQQVDITIDVCDDTINWSNESQKIKVIVQAFLDFGNIDDINIEQLMNDRSSENKEKVKVLVKALDDSQVFGPVIFKTIEKMLLENDYEITITEEDKALIRTNTWDKELDVTFEMIDEIEVLLGENGKYTYNTIPGTEVSKIMLKASESIIASKVVGYTLNDVLGEDYLNINPKENGVYKYDFTNPETLSQEASTVEKLIDLKYLVDSTSTTDEIVESVVDIVKTLEKDDITKDLLNGVLESNNIENMEQIDFEKEATLIESSYNEYKENDVISSEKLEELEESTLAKEILKRLGIIE